MVDIKIKTTTTVDPDLKELADLHGIDLSKAVEAGLDILLGLNPNY